MEVDEDLLAEGFRDSAAPDTPQHKDMEVGGALHPLEQPPEQFPLASLEVADGGVVTLGSIQAVDSSSSPVRRSVPYLTPRLLSFEDLLSIPSMDAASIETDALGRRVSNDDQGLLEQLANACSGILVQDGRRRSTKHSVSFNPTDLERPPSRILHVPPPPMEPPAPAASSPNPCESVPIHTPVARIGPRTASSPSLKLRATGRSSFSSSPSRRPGDTTPPQWVVGQDWDAGLTPDVGAVEETETNSRRSLAADERQQREGLEDSFHHHASSLLQGMEEDVQQQREAARARSRAAILQRHVALVREMQLLQCCTEEEEARAAISSEAMVGAQKVLQLAEHTLGPAKQRAKVVGEECRTRSILLKRWRESLEALCRLFSCQMEEQEWRSEIVIAMADAWEELTAHCSRVAAAAWLRLHDAQVALQGAEKQQRDQIVDSEAMAWVALESSPVAEAIHAHSNEAYEMLERVTPLSSSALPPGATVPRRDSLPIWLQDESSVPAARTLVSYIGTSPSGPSASASMAPDGQQSMDKTKVAVRENLNPTWLHQDGPWGEPADAIVSTPPSDPPWLEGEPSSIGLVSMDPTRGVPSPSIQLQRPRAEDCRALSSASLVSLACNPATSFVQAYHMTHVAPPTPPPEDGSPCPSQPFSLQRRQKVPHDEDSVAASFSSRSSLTSLTASHATISPGYSPTSAPPLSAQRSVSVASDITSPFKFSPLPSAVGFQEAPSIIVKDVRTAFQLDMADGKIDGQFMGAEIVTQLPDGKNGVRNVRPRTASEYQRLLQWEVEWRLGSQAVNTPKTAERVRSTEPFGPF
eukprot:GGOE01041054.1.p1 GENE.GGOE01041054.1~~GGOE01041054.1.p1  ORF type:complete len:812 (-),score=105.38 GGOE01041054.1:311-2746(-)